LEAEVGAETAEKVLKFIEPKESFLETLKSMLSFCDPGDTAAIEAAQRLEEVYNIAQVSGNADSLVLDPSITRGLDYYTGIVFETNLSEMPEIGSVCSGGRYNELASLYTSRKLPGVGASVGLDRLLAALEFLGKTPRSRKGPKVLLLCGDARLLPELHKIATSLRVGGVSTEVYPEAKKVSAQYGYAEKKAIPFALSLDEEALGKGIFPLRNLADRATTDYNSLEALVAYLGSIE
jgi:histidyl-tRNA synthetase